MCIQTLFLLFKLTKVLRDIVNISLLFGSVCPRSSDPIYLVIYYIKWGTTSWTDGTTEGFFCNN